MDDFRATLARFRVPLEDNHGLSQGVWTLDAVYLSNTALVLDVGAPIGAAPRQLPAHRDELDRLARQLSHRAADHGVLRPVALVVRVESDELHAELNRWTFDQDWHRGEFLFYLVSKDEEHADLLRDLVAEGETESVEVGERLDERVLQARVEARMSPDHELFERLRAALVAPQPGSAIEAGAGLDAVAAWTSEALREAEKLTAQPTPEEGRLA